MIHFLLTHWHLFAPIGALPFLMLGDIGGGGTSAKETTQTASGSGRNQSGKAQYTEGGAIGVGSKAKYLESGSLDGGKGNKFGADFSGTKGDITINDSGGATALALVDKLTGLIGSPSSPNAGTGTVTPPAPTPGPSTVKDNPDPTKTTPAAGETNTLKLFWQNMPATQKIAAAVLLAILLWFFFRKRK